MIKKTDNDLWLDFNGKLIKRYTVNNELMRESRIFNQHRVLIPKEYKMEGENEVKIF